MYNNVPLRVALKAQVKVRPIETESLELIILPVRHTKAFEYFLHSQICRYGFPIRHPIY